MERAFERHPHPFLISVEDRANISHSYLSSDSPPDSRSIFTFSSFHPSYERPLRSVKSREFSIIPNSLLHLHILTQKKAESARVSRRRRRRRTVASPPPMIPDENGGRRRSSSLFPFVIRWLKWMQMRHLSDPFLRSACECCFFIHLSLIWCWSGLSISIVSLSFYSVICYPLGDAPSPTEKKYQNACITSNVSSILIVFL